MTTKLGANQSLQDFEKFVIHQPDLMDRLSKYDGANPLLQEILRFEMFKFDMLRPIMIMGMWLYREWLIAHGDSKVQEVENKLKW